MDNGAVSGQQRASDQADEGSSSDSEHQGLLTKVRNLFSPATKNDALTQALQQGNGVAAGLSDARRDMIERVIAFDSKEVEDVMIPRADIVAVEKDISLTDLLKAFSDAGHSRLPVYRGDLDDPLGMVHIRDLVAVLAEPGQEDISDTETVLTKLTRKVLYVPPSMPVTDLLLRMQAQRIHMALVIDEFGGTDGLVTIEDLVEEIVGDIQDEHDEDEDDELRLIGDDIWIASARLALDDLEAALMINFDLEEDEVDTVGGLVFTLVGRVPARGEVIPHLSGYEFEVLEADPRRIRKVKIRRKKKKKATDSVPDQYTSATEDQDAENATD